MNNIEINNIKETALLVILDSVELEKTMSYHDLFLLWSNAFENVGIPIYIVFPDDVMKLKKFLRVNNLCARDCFIYGLI